MKTLRPLALLLALTPALLHAQGSLTPPAGLPVASMKTLDQVEARKPIQSLAASAPYTITQSGSYYLTGNITVSTNLSAIIVGDNVNDVTIDLNGFTIESTLATAGTASAISFATSARITVRNGSIRSGTTITPAGVGSLTGRGFAHAIFTPGFLTECLISGVKVTGMHSFAIVCDGNSLVENCQVTHSQTGILNSDGLTRGCIVSNCLNTGIITRTAESCSATSYQSTGIDARIALNCTGTSTNGTGLNAPTATNCAGRSTSSIGLSATTATNCNGSSIDGTGLRATTATNCTGTTSSNDAEDIGLEATGTANTCRGTSGAGATALKAAIAIGCTFSGGTLDVPLAKRFNM